MSLARLATPATGALALLARLLGAGCLGYRVVRQRLSHAVVSRTIGLSIVVLLITTGCITVKPFTNYEGLARPDTDVAIIDNRWGGCPWCIRSIVSAEDRAVVVFQSRDHGHAVNPVKLTPGRYVIVARYDLDPGMAASMEATLTLQPGHRYSVRMVGVLRRIFDGPKIWITDDTENRTMTSE